MPFTQTTSGSLVHKHKTILLIVNTTAAPALACEQALWGTLAAGPEKEGELATTSLEFEYLHGNVDAKY